MRLPASFTPVTILSFVVASLVSSLVRAQGTSTTYFMISEPVAGRSWANGVANPVQWTKGLRDGIQNFDVEMARMSQDGILYVARNVPATFTSFNVFLENVPTGDDYYMIFINSTHGVLYAITSQFSIVSSASNGSLASPVASAPTVTLSGPPNPTALFATTYPATSDGIPANWVGMGGWMSSGFTIFCGATAGALMILV